MTSRRPDLRSAHLDQPSDGVKDVAGSPRPNVQPGSRFASTTDTAGPFDGRDRWHTQSLLGGGDVPPEERGDCVRACITSILGLPLDAIENVHGDQWWDRLNAEVAKHGYTLAILWLDFAPPDGYWIASVPSLSLGPEPDGAQALHAVVCKGYDLVHDPGMKRRYTADEWARAWNENKVVEGWALIPIDPVEARRAA